MASVSVVKIKVRRGTDAERKQIVLDNGELGFTIDSKRLFIGDGVVFGGVPASSKVFFANTSNYATYANTLVGDLIYDYNTTLLNAVTAIDSSTPTPTYSFIKIGPSPDNTTIEFNVTSRLRVKDAGITETKIASTSFNQTLSGGSGSKIGINYDNNTLTLVAGKLAVNDSGLNLGSINSVGQTVNAVTLTFSNLPAINPGVTGRLWRDGSGFLRVS